MTDAMHQFMMIDAPPLVAGSLAAATCALLGNFLVLRRLSLMGDAISHAVLPGLVIAFLISGSRGPMPMLLGATVAGLVTVALVELLHRTGRIEPGAAMGVTFSILFALGVILLRRAAADHTDLDADCVLYGNLENVAWWSAPDSWRHYLDLDIYTITSDHAIPRQIPTLLVMALITTAFVLLFFKELRITSFDPGLASALGFSAGGMHFALMLLVAGATVASFEAVGSILVIAMLICPAATARLLTDRLRTQVLLSAIIGVGAGSGGYVAGALLPLWLGFEHSINAAGAMTVLAGLIFASAVVASPSHGLVAKRLRRRYLASRVATEDLLAAVYRQLEQQKPPLSLPDLSRMLGSTTRARRAIRDATRAGWITTHGGRLRLTQDGADKAARIVRSHRLWETYLVEEMGVRPDHVHDTAMILEHLRDEAAQRRLAPASGAERDPHDRLIPPPPDRDQSI
jgi:manganese/zinc/iron transport system permease protein